jgi:hypothetical protein
MNRKLVFLVVVIVTCFTLSAAAQQTTVNRYDLFTGYSHLSSPSVSLQQNGFNTSFGVNLKRWVAVGGDFSVFKGDGDINFADTKIASQVAALIPPGVTVPAIPFSATTYTFAAGPQFNYRHFDKITLFARPGLGGLHEHANLSVPVGLLPLLPLIPGLSTSLTDTVVFYGVGGGVDLNASKHVGVRFSVDFVHTSLFSNLLQSRNAVRFSVGPTWKWGELK